MKRSASGFNPFKSKWNMRQGSNTGRRPRGRPNRRQHGSNGGQRSGNFDSNGPEGRIRGSAAQVYEKYMNFARDATSGGDRVAAEAYFQHAEHYFRIINDSTDPRSESQSATRQQHSGGRDPRDDNGPADEADDYSEQPPANQPPPNQPRANQPQVSQPQVSQPRANQPRDNQPRDNQPRANQPQVSQARANSAQGGRRPDAESQDGKGQALADAPQPESPPEAFGLPPTGNDGARSELEGVGFLKAVPLTSDAESPAPAVSDRAAEAPRPRRGRPPKKAAADGGEVTAKPRRARVAKAPSEDKAATVVEENSDSDSDPITG